MRVENTEYSEHAIFKTYIIKKITVSYTGKEL